MIAIYIVFNLSCIMFYLRRKRDEFNVILHLIIPVLGIAAFVPAFFTALGIGSSVLKFVTPLSYPSSETGLAIGIWYIIGLAVLAYLYIRHPYIRHPYIKHPQRLPEMKRVFADEPVSAQAQQVEA
jgi:amino acid transporter